MEAQIKQIFQADRKFFRVTDCLIGINYCMFNFDALCRKFPVTKFVKPLCQFIDSSIPYFSLGGPLTIFNFHYTIDSKKLHDYGPNSESVKSQPILFNL